jgi:hypothetical protein
MLRRRPLSGSRLWVANDRIRRFSPATLRSLEGPLTEPTADAQPWLRGRVLMPVSGQMAFAAPANAAVR